MPNIMLLQNEETWPAQVIDYLDFHHKLFLNWELGTSSRVRGLEYDRAIYGLRDVLRVDCTLHGYHCTRLTDAEIRHVLSNGMQLPGKAMLHRRIDAIQRARLIDADVAACLKDRNQAHEKYRAGMLWFCFFPPHLAGQSGIERFFRSWGGEALYNSHEEDPITGPILGRIGVPCIVEAHVPWRNLGVGLEFKVIRRYLVNRGLDTCEPLDHEDRVKQPIPAENMVGIIRFPDSEFLRLTQCDAWKPELT